MGEYCYQGDRSQYDRLFQQQLGFLLNFMELSTASLLKKNSHRWANAEKFVGLQKYEQVNRKCPQEHDLYRSTSTHF